MSFYVLSHEAAVGLRPVTNLSFEPINNWGAIIFPGHKSHDITWDVTCHVSDLTWDTRVSTLHTDILIISPSLRQSGTRVHQARWILVNQPMRANKTDSNFSMSVRLEGKSSFLHTYKISIM